MLLRFKSMLTKLLESAKTLIQVGCSWCAVLRPSKIVTDHHSVVPCVCEKVAGPCKRSSRAKGATTVKIVMIIWDGILRAVSALSHSYICGIKDIISIFKDKSCGAETLNLKKSEKVGRTIDEIVHK